MRDACSSSAPSLDSDGEMPTSVMDLKPPVLNKYTDMQDLLLIDPIHDVEAHGWPAKREGEPV